MKCLVYIFNSFLLFFSMFIYSQETVVKPITLQDIERTFISAFTAVYGTDILDITKADVKAVNNWHNSLKAIGNFLKSNQSVLSPFFERLELITINLEAKHLEMDLIKTGIIEAKTINDCLQLEQRLNRLKQSLTNENNDINAIKERIETLKDLNAGNKRFIDIFIAFLNKNIERTSIKIDELFKNLYNRKQEITKLQQTRVKRFRRRYL